MFKVISYKMAQWYHMINGFIISINFHNAKIMNCAFIFIKAIIMEELFLVV